MPSQERVLDVLETGARVVVAFRNTNTWDYHILAKCEDEIDGIIETYAFETLVFDLSNLKMMSSTLLGILVHLYKSGLKIRLRNPTESVREILETTELYRVLPVDPGNNA